MLTTLQNHVKYKLLDFGLQIRCLFASWLFVKIITGGEREMKKIVPLSRYEEGYLNSQMTC